MPRSGKKSLANSARTRCRRRARLGPTRPPMMPSPLTWRGKLDAAIAAKPNPGHVPVHRLNRTEYTNAIRDLLGLKIDGESLLIADEPDNQGFENIAGLLSVSPSRLERYLAAARKISRLAVGDPTINPIVETYTIHARSRSGRSSQRGPAVRDAGRNRDRSFLSHRRRVQHQGSPETPGLPLHHGHGRGTRA